MDINTLQDYYMKKYDEQLKEFCKDYLDMESSESAEEIFKNSCKKIVGENDNKFCHDMIDSDITIREYKEQFKPLKEWERNNNGK